MELKINGNTIIYNSEKNIILKQGAVLKTAQKSLSRNAKLTKLRADFTTTDASGVITTTCDITFSNKSSIATFIEGNSRSGTEYFKKYLRTETTEAPKTTETINEPSSKEEAPKTTEAKEEPLSTMTKEQRNKLAKSILTFCKDFEFKPDPRLLNSLQFEENPSEFFVNSLELIGFEEDLVAKAKDKFKSIEWREIIKTLKGLRPSHDRFNQRLEIKYGGAGTGKTTSAIAEYPKAHKIVASASADPDDLFTFFDPETKKYELTDIGYAMEKGEVIIIDEANLYNGVVLQRLQGITDSTDSIYDRGREIKIAKGFKVVMTLNLETNFGKTPLPIPLVSRASKIQNYDNLQDLSWVW